MVYVHCLLCQELKKLILLLQNKLFSYEDKYKADMIYGYRKATFFPFTLSLTHETLTSWWFRAHCWAAKWWAAKWWAAKWWPAKWWAAK